MGKRRYTGGREPGQPYFGRPTRYAGELFRSYTESLWARVFDAVGLEWACEPSRYEFGSHSYLPDFWLPAPGCFVEVKPTDPLLLEWWLCARLCELTRCPVLILVGQPQTFDCVEYQPGPQPGLRPYVLLSEGEWFLEKLRA